MDLDRKKPARPLPLKLYGLTLAVIWTLVAAASLTWSLVQEHWESISIARHIAATIFERDLLYRRWSAAHGGVYVPVTPETPPNPYLSHIPERDLKTASGWSLTLLNPAYMTRQVYELAREAGQTPGHLTSLKPLRPENAPDSWERAALTAFEQGQTEVSTVVDLNGRPFLRLMRPFITEQSCLRCHAQQGYQEGDIRGGISVSVPLGPLFKENWHTFHSIVFGHLGLWLLGLVGIVITGRQLGKSTRERIKAQEAAAAATMAVQTIEGMRDSVIITDLAGRITHANKALTDSFGWGSEALGETPTKLVQARDIPEMLAGIHECLEKGYKTDVECTLVTKDQQEVPVSINFSLLQDPDHHPMGAIGVIRDITAQRQAEEELERRVRERTAQLEAALQELEGFSYSVSHDLRAPLRAIDGFSRILSKEYHGRLDAEGQRLLQIISTNTQKMGQLIDDLLVFSRLGRQEMKMEVLDMELAVRTVIAELQGTAAEREVQWQLNPLPPARGDRNLMHQVWYNLLANALKFTRPREAPVIEVGCRHAGSETIYYIKDNGVGFDGRYAHKLFGVFQRLHRLEEFEGTGVGLALVQRIVNRHGGRIWAEGEVDGGATFYFTISAASD